MTRNPRTKRRSEAKSNTQMSPVNDSLRDGNSSDKTGLRISTTMVSKKESRSLTRNSQGDKYRPLRENQAEENIPDDFSFLLSIAKTEILDYGNFITANHKPVIMVSRNPSSQFRIHPIPQEMLY
jgi:hypothetical protein